jgi:hypothetical protein
MTTRHPTQCAGLSGECPNPPDRNGYCWAHQMRDGWHPIRCGDLGPYGQRCLLTPDHQGWHKSTHHAWVNRADTLDWAAIGRRLLAGEMMVHLSLDELNFAIAAAGGWPTDTGG